MSNTSISNEQWEKLYQFLLAHPNIYALNETATRTFLEGVFWRLRTGGQWRELPEKYGKWNTIFRRFSRWEQRYIWDDMFDYFADDPDMEYLMLDSTIVRAHPAAASALKKGGQQAQALGRSRGGFSTKIHVLVDSLGNPLHILLTGGQRHDVSQAESLLADFQSQYVIADRGYDSNAFVALVEQRNAEAIIPPRRNRKEQRPYDQHLYKERHLVECFINQMKHYRGVFSRFDKLVRRYLSFILFASTLIWLR